MLNERSLQNCKTAPVASRVRYNVQRNKEIRAASRIHILEAIEFNMIPPWGFPGSRHYLFPGFDICPKCYADFDEVDGMPGETITICSNPACRFIAGCDFDRSSVI